MKIFFFIIYCAIDKCEIQKIWRKWYLFFIDATNITNFIECNGTTCISKWLEGSSNNIVKVNDGTNAVKEREIICNENRCKDRSFFLLN